MTTRVAAPDDNSKVEEILKNIKGLNIMELVELVKDLRREFQEE